MKRIIGLFLLTGILVQVEAQRILSLDSCRALAIRNNKELNISKIKQDVAKDNRKAARTKYYPTVDAVGSYMYTSKEISILNDDQKTGLSNIGTTTVTQASGGVASWVSQLVQGGLLSQEQAVAMGKVLSQASGTFSSAMNSLGQKIVDDFRTDTRNMWIGSIVLNQPIYMGGKITAYNNITKYYEKIADNQNDASLQSILLDIDQAYWSVVSLKHKKHLAQGYYDLVKKLDSDVAKMIQEGVATRADGLSVSVKVNEAEMTLMQVDDGLTLSKMLLCQLCGLPMNELVTLVDEDKENLFAAEMNAQPEVETAMTNRPELKMLNSAVEINRQNVKLVRSEYLPTLVLTGGYTVMNPNIYNGYEKKFSGVWNAGVLLRVPLWHWMDGTYKVRAAKSQQIIATMQLNDAKEKIELQVNQSTFNVNEANKKLAMANKNTERADENLRCATLGFKEGVIPTSNVLEAQTAWLQAKSQKIDAEINVKLTQVYLKRALGVLQ
jgi:outer membrane protein TolC